MLNAPSESTNIGWIPCLPLKLLYAAGVAIALNLIVLIEVAMLPLLDLVIMGRTSDTEDIANG